MVLKYIYIGLICFFISSLGISQDIKTDESCTSIIKGKVIDGENLTPIRGAVIFIEELTKVAVSDSFGVYMIKGLCPGTYDIKTEFAGYKLFSSEITVKNDEFFDFVMHSDTCFLNSVVVTARAQNNFETNPYSELKGIRLDRGKGFSLGEAIRELSGITVLQTGPTVFKPVIEGMHGNRILILNNEVRMEGQQWGNDHGPEIDPSIAGKLTVIKGAAGVRYGADAIGGVLLVEPRPLLTQPGFRGEINIFGMSNGRQGTISGVADYHFKKIEGLAFRLQGTLKKGGNFNTPDFYLDNTGHKQYNFSWNAGYKVKNLDIEIFYSQYNTAIGIFSGSHTGSPQDFQQAINNKLALSHTEFSYQIQGPYQQVNHELLKIKSKLYLNKFGKISLIVARQFNDRSEYDSHRPYNDNNSGKPAVRFKITTHTVNPVWENNFFKNTTEQIGLLGIVQKNTTSGYVRSLIPNFESFSGGVFFIEKWKKNNLQLELGFRHDYKNLKVYKIKNGIVESPKFTFTNTLFTVGAAFNITENFLLKLQTGQGFRPPSVNDLFSSGVHHGTASYEIGNDKLISEKANNTNLSGVFSLGKMKGEVNVFYNYIKNHIYLAPDSLPTSTIRGTFSTFRYRQADASYYGGDISLSDTIMQGLVYTLKGSVTYAYNHSLNDYLVNIPYPFLENEFFYYPFKSGSFKSLYVNFQHQWNLRPFRVSKMYDYLPPPSGYHLFNLYVGGSFNSFKKNRIEWEVGGTNLFNERYRSYLDRFRYFHDAVGRSINLRLKIPFN